VSDRVYEILFIADPNLGEPEVDALTTQVQGYLEKEGARIQKVEKWGKKRLAYVIGKHREGSYVLLVAEGKPALVTEVERRIRVTDGVIKFMTVRVDEDLRKAEGRKARRAKWEAARKGRTAAKPAPAPPPAPAEGEEVQA
jgi:small subunit ribosomal protein S6